MAYTTVDDGSAHFQAAIWTGSSGTDTITFDGNSDLQLDFLWTKARNASYSNALMDTSRITSGDYLPLFSDGTQIEQTTYDSELQSITSDGFTVGTQPHAGNNGTNYVGLAWKANGASRTTFTESGANPGGGYQANTTGGFSIVDYTGTGSAGTVSHGLGATPKVLIVKNTEDTTNWAVYHRNASSAGNDSYLELDTGDPVATAGTGWNDTSPSSSVFTVGTNTKTNTDGEEYIAYCFTEIQGYSKMGRYFGNSNSDGAFIYTGFKPAFLIIKNISATQSWWYFDNKRTGAYNGADVRLRADRDSSESTGSKVDFLSNGFKWRDGDNAWNYQGNTFVYLAFAEHPFVSSKGVPVTAR